MSLKPKEKHRPGRAFRKVVELDQEVSEVQGLCQATYDRADQEKRGLSDDELEMMTTQQEYLEYLEDEIRPTVISFEAKQRELAEAEFRRRASEHRQPVGDQSHLPAKYSDSLRVSTGLPTMVAPKLECFRADLFGGKREAEQAAYDAGHWLKAYLYRDKKSIDYCEARNQEVHTERGNYLPLQGNVDERFDAQTVDEATKGGVLVPTVIARTILDVRDRYGLIAQLARRYPMQSEVDNVPKRAGGLTVYKPGEDAAITASEKTFGTSVALTATDAYTLTKVSHKLMRGSIVAAADQVVNEIGWSFASGQDYEGLMGDGTAGTPDWGITGATVGASDGSIVTMASTKTAWTDVTAANLTAMMGLLPDRFYASSPSGPIAGQMIEGPVWVCSRAFWATVFMPLLDAGGGNNKFDLSSTTPFQYAGFPIRFSEHMPTATAVDTRSLLFGNFRDSIILGERETLGISASTERYFEEDSVAIKGRLTYDLQYHERGGASTAGGIVALATAAS